MPFPESLAVSGSTLRLGVAGVAAPLLSFQNSTSEGVREQGETQGLPDFLPHRPLSKIKSDKAVSQDSSIINPPPAPSRLIVLLQDLF